MLSYSLGFWFGSDCIEGNSSCPSNISGKIYSPGDVTTVFFCILIASFNLSQLTPSFQKVAEGKQAATQIYKIIDRVPLVKNQENPLTPAEIHGRV